MLGFAAAILVHLKFLMGENYPGTKIVPSGFLKMLIQNNPSLRVSGVNGETIDGLKRSTASGHIRDVRIKYLPRITSSQVVDTDDCDNNVGFQYTESSLNTPLFSKLGFRLEWDFVERYQNEASKLVKVGSKPDFVVLNELLEQLMHCVSGIVENMDTKLIGSVVFGVNQTTGNNAAKVININRSADTFDLSAGVTEILSDTMENEFVGSPLIVGSGLMNKYNIAQKTGAPNASGQSGFNWNFDVNTAGVWGANQVAAFAKGAVGFVDVDKYIAWKAGRFGTSEFAQIMIPVESGVEGLPPVTMTLNLQIREIDCPDEAFDGYETRPMGRGYQVLISKNFGLFQQPLDAYQATDRLTGTNGALRYEITNDCDPCPESVV